MDQLSLSPSTSDLIRASGVGFGTSGARALVDSLTDDVCAAFVLAFLAVAADRFDFDRVAVGWDLRPSSPAIANAVIAAIRAAGYEPDCCGTLPTPALAFHAMGERIPAVMVTGSHIPFDRNGLKFYRPDGEIDKDDEAAILSAALPMKGIKPGLLPTVRSTAIEGYIRRYLDFFPPALLEGKRIGIYQHSSVSRDVMARILRELGADVIELGRTDLFVPIDTEAVAETDVQRGLDWAREYRLDALVSTDGDGDRPLISDEGGNWLRGDIVGLLCARHLGIEALAVPVSCNTAIERSGSFGSVTRTQIGSPHVIAAMTALGGSVRRTAGFEANGGFLLGCKIDSGCGSMTPLPTRDAVLPVLAVLATAVEAGVPLSALTANLPARHTASDRLQEVPMEQSRAWLAAFGRQPSRLLEMAGFGACMPDSTDFTDGLRLTAPGGDIVHLRPSGNAPELRCYCEAGTPERARHLVETVLSNLGQRAPN